MSIIDIKIKKNLKNGFFNFNPKIKKPPTYKIKITKSIDDLPNMIIRTLEEIAPQNPKKFLTSDFPNNLPIPGSFEL